MLIGALAAGAESAAESIVIAASLNPVVGKVPLIVPWPLLRNEFSLKLQLIVYKAKDRSARQDSLGRGSTLIFADPHPHRSASRFSFL